MGDRKNFEPTMAEPMMSGPSSAYPQPPPAYSVDPPPPMHPPPGVAVGTAAVTTTTFIVASPPGPSPMITMCPSCRHQIVTRTETKATGKTHCIACFLFCFVLWPCICLPYCMDSCNNVDHYCPNCSAYIGGYKF